MTQVVTTQSWGSRLKNAIFGVFFGIILIIGAIYFIFDNEKSNLQTSKSLKQAEANVFHIANSPIDPHNNTKVVHLTGLATTNDTLKDDLLMISEKAIRLIRQVEMYQWHEKSETKTEDNLGGSQTQTTTYSYYPEWDSMLIDSSRFNDQSGHQNPTTMAIPSAFWQAQNVIVGDFRLSTALINKMNGETNVDLSHVDVDALQAKINLVVTHYGNYLYVGANPKQAAIGDLRVKEAVVLPQMVSIVAQQHDSILSPYSAPAGKPVALVESGEQSPQEMFQNAQHQNYFYTWSIRAATLIALIVGFALILQPITILAAVVPVFARIVGTGTTLIALVCGLSLWAVMTCVAYFAFRPFIAIAIIVIGIVIWLLIAKLRKK